MAFFDTLSLKNAQINSFGEPYFQIINQNAFINMPSSAVFTKTYIDTFEADKQLYLIVGSDSGLLIPFLEKRAQKLKAVQFIIFEHPKMVEYIQNQMDLSQYKHITLLPEKSDLNLLSEKFPDYVTHNRMQIIRSLAVLDHTNEYYDQLWEDLFVKFRAFQMDQTAVHQNSNFINSQIYNLANNIDPVALLEKKFSQTQAIILGGGPTLDTGIEWVKQHKNNLVIFAAGRISQRLLNEGISPDFIVTVDPNDVSYDNTKKMALFSDDSILIHTNYAHHSLLAEWAGLHCFTEAQYPWAEPSQPDNLVTSGPTVTNTIASICAFLGFDEIYLLGVDFCYSQTGQTHESSSLEKNLGQYVHEVAQQVETYSGRQADTNDVFAQAAHSMNQLAEALMPLNIKMFNLGFESAKLEHVPYVPFDSVSSFKNTTQKQTLMTECQTLLTLTPHKVQRHLKQSKKNLQHFRKSIKTMSSLAESGLEAAKKLFNETEKVDFLTQKITRTKNKLGKQYLGHLEFLFNYAIDAYADFMDPSIDQDKEMSEEQIKTNLTDFFMAIHETCEDLLVHLDKGIKHLNIRLKEAEGEVALETLITYWKAHNEEGRILGWLKQYHLDLTAFSEPHQKAANELIAYFEHKIASAENSKLAKRLQEKAEKLTTQFQLIESFFQDKEVDKMNEMVAYLSTKESTRGIELHKLAQGYLYELKGQFSEALATYVTIEDPTLLHHGLKQVVQISLNEGDYQSALNALEVLTQYSDEYFIMYANLLSSMNDKPGAIQVYLHYLSKHEEDHATRVKLAKTLLELNLVEDCLMMLDKVLLEDPDDPAALALKQQALELQKDKN